MRVSVLGAGMVLAGSLLPAAAAGGAQPPPQVTAANAGENQVQAERRHVSVMEGVLQKAVEDGARRTGLKLQAMVPEPLLWNGEARAHGFRLDGYGFLFYVEIPTLRGSIAWSLQILDRTQVEVQNQLGGLLKSLRTQLQLVNDARAREQMDQTLRRIEVQIIGPEPVESGSPMRAALPLARPGRPPLDPNEQYTEDVRNALIDAMLEYGDKLRIAADEWLTVAARDNESGGIGPGQGDFITLILRVRGSDLAALHGGRLSPEEARKRVEIREF